MTTALVGELVAVFDPVALDSPHGRGQGMGYVCGNRGYRSEAAAPEMETAGCGECRSPRMR